MNEIRKGFHDRSLAGSTGLRRVAIPRSVNFSWLYTERLLAALARYQYSLFLNSTPAMARETTPIRAMGTYWVHSRSNDAPCRNTDLTITSM